MVIVQKEKSGHVATVTHGAGRNANTQSFDENLPKVTQARFLTNHTRGGVDVSPQRLFEYSSALGMEHSREKNPFKKLQQLLASSNTEDTGARFASEARVSSGTFTDMIGQVFTSVGYVLIPRPLRALAQSGYEYVVRGYDYVASIFSERSRSSAVIRVPDEAPEVSGRQQLSVERSPKIRLGLSKDSEASAKQTYRRRSGKRQLEMCNEQDGGVEALDPDAALEDGRDHRRQQQDIRDDEREQKHERELVETVANRSRVTVNDPIVDELLAGLGTHYDVIERVLDQLAERQRPDFFANMSRKPVHVQDYDEDKD